MAKVFVSYSRKDIDFAKRLTAELQKSDLELDRLGISGSALIISANSPKSEM